MTCKPIKVGDAEGWACSRGQRKATCRFCGREATLLCDYALTGRREGSTCDVAMCASCAVRQPVASPYEGDTVDYCAPHARIAAKLEQGKSSAP